MLSHSQAHTLFKLNKDKTSLFTLLPREIINFTTLCYDPNSDSDIAKVLRYAASGEQEDIDAIVAMVKLNPQLLLQAGSVFTRGGIIVERTTLYEFFLGAGDPYAAKQIEFGFEEIVNGEQERISQCARYKPYLEALMQQIKAKKPAYDLKPLFDVIKKGSDADITAAMAKFRKAVSSQRQTVGLHYEYYATLIQAFNLLHEDWEILTSTNYGKRLCLLIWRRVIGYLLRSLPAVDRFAFARGFSDDIRTLDFVDGSGSFPDVLADDKRFSGLGFDYAIFGCVRSKGMRGVFQDLSFDLWQNNESCAALFARHLSNKTANLLELMSPRREQAAECVIC